MIVIKSCFLPLFYKTPSIFKAVHFHDVVTTQPNAITNYIQITSVHGDAATLNSLVTPNIAIISSNDDCVRIFDMPVCKESLKFTFPCPVNHATLSPLGKLICVAGDNENVMLVDSSTGKLVNVLKGHRDFSFATAWNPINNYQVATGAQDKTTRVWDIRTLTSLKVLPACIGSVRSLEYSHDGKILAAAECADFVHLYDAQKEYSREQQLDLFGEIAGVSFTPGDDDCLFIGIFDRVYKSLIEFSKVKLFDICNVVI